MVYIFYSKEKVNHILPNAKYAVNRSILSRAIVHTNQTDTSLELVSKCDIPSSLNVMYNYTQNVWKNKTR